MTVIKNLEKWYRNTRVMEINDLAIEPGEFLGIVGNNGAGNMLSDNSTALFNGYHRIPKLAP